MVCFRIFLFGILRRAHYLSIIQNYNHYEKNSNVFRFIMLDKPDICPTSGKYLPEWA